MRLVKPVLFCVLLGGCLLAAGGAMAAAREGGGGHEGGGSKGGGSAGPVPLLGVTLLGQAGGAAGIYAAWRRRNRKK